MKHVERTLPAIRIGAGAVLLIVALTNGYAGVQEDRAARDARAEEAEELDVIRTAADAGDVDSQFRLAQLLRMEPSLAAVDRWEFVVWYRRAADQGHAAAQSALARLYRDGNGVNQDYAEATRWYELSANQGNVEAQIGLGDFYRDGVGVDQDFAAAARWYRLAADAGDGLAQFDLADLYIDGNGVPEDHQLAYMWLTLAVVHWPVAETNLVAQLRDLIGAGLTEEERAEARLQASEWKPNGL